MCLIKVNVFHKKTYRFAEAFGGASYGEGIGSVMMNNVRCVGNEIDIGDCSFDGWRSGNCSHSKDVGVSCGIVPYYTFQTLNLKFEQATFRIATIITMYCYTSCKASKNVMK